MKGTPKTPVVVTPNKTGKLPATPSAPSTRINNLGAFAHPAKKKGRK